MKTYEYKFKPGSRLKASLAPMVGAALAEIAGGTDFSQLDPEKVFSVVEREDHPLHPLVFDKTKDEAAREHYLGNIEHLIRNTVYVVVVKNAPISGAVEVRPWIHSESSGIYVARPRVLKDKELRAEMIEKALDELESWRHRYVDLQELWPLSTAIASGIKAARGKIDKAAS